MGPVRERDPIWVPLSNVSRYHGDGLTTDTIKTCLPLLSNVRKVVYKSQILSLYDYKGEFRKHGRGERRTFRQGTRTIENLVTRVQRKSLLYVDPGVPEGRRPWTLIPTKTGASCVCRTVGPLARGGEARKDPKDKEEERTGTSPCGNDYSVGK